MSTPTIQSFIAAILCAGLGLAPAAHAQIPSTLSVGGELFGSDGLAISAASVNFKVQVLDANGLCTLYTESHSAQDLAVSKGRFNLLLGQGTSRVNNVDGTGQLDAKVFLNPGVTSVTGCAQATVPLTAGDARLLRISYDLGTGYTALTPDVPVVAAAYALIADSLEGKGAGEFIQVADNGSSALTQANAESAFSTTNWPKLQALLNGTSSQYLGSSPSVPVDLNGQRLVNVADPTAAQNAATKNYVDTTVAGKPVDVTAVGPMTGNGSVLKWDATANKWVAGTISTSATGTAGGDLQGSYPNPTIKNDAITAAKIASSGGGTNRLLITSASDGTTVGYGACAVSEVYAWTASGWACASVSSLAPVTKVAGRTGNVTLNAGDVSGLGTAALKDVGVAAGQVPVLDGSARLPAVDGSQLVNVNATRLQGRTVAATLPTASQVLGWNVTLAQWEPTTVTAGGGSPSFPLLANPVGTAAAPAYSFSGNANTGLYSPGPNQVALATNGAAALTIDASGNVGVGSTSPQYTLDVVGIFSADRSRPKGGTAAFPTYAFANTVNFGAGNDMGMFFAGSGELGFSTVSQERLRISATGNVGIGTTAPRAGLDIAATGSASAVIVPRDTTANRPSTPVNGMIRYNSTSNAFEGYVNGTWMQVAMQATGTTTPVTVSGPPVGASIYTGATLSANYTPAYGSITNLTNGVYPANGTNVGGSSACVSLPNDAGDAIVLDYGSVKTINKAYADFYDGYQYNGLGISFSTDGVTYNSSTTIPSTTYNSGGSNYFSITLGSTVTARYVRLTNMNSNNPYQNMFCQFAVGP